MQTLEPEPAATLELNSIGIVEVECTRPLFLDTYDDQRITGSFILIDPLSHATVAAGMVREILTAAPRKARASIKVAPELLGQIETALLADGKEVVRTRTATPELIQRLLHAGVVVLVESEAAVFGASQEAIDRAIAGGKQ
jgi:hypothetical protein